VLFTVTTIAAFSAFKNTLFVFVVVCIFAPMRVLFNLYKQYSTSIHVCKEKSFVRKQALSIFLLSACFY
jgi:hypothetical protein